MGWKGGVCCGGCGNEEIPVVIEDNSDQVMLVLDVWCDYNYSFYTSSTTTSTNRKRISDFYQRTSMTSYCTAFAYKPLLPPAKSPETFVIDLPPLVDLR